MRSLPRVPFLRVLVTSLRSSSITRRMPPAGDPRDALRGLRVRRAVVVGAQQRVDELCRRRGYADNTVQGLSGSSKVGAAHHFVGGRTVGMVSAAAWPV